MNKFVPFVLATALASSAQAVQYGLGTSINDSQLYMPINVSETFRVEPAVYFSNNESSKDDEYRSSSDRSYVRLTSGFFKLSQLSERTSTFVGSRVGLIRYDYKSEDNNSRYTSYERGFIIEPTVGFEFFPIKNFSISGEASVYFSRTKETNSSSYEFSSGENSNYHDEYSNETGSRTLVSVRMYF